MAPATSNKPTLAQMTPPGTCTAHVSPDGLVGWTFPSAAERDAAWDRLKVLGYRMNTLMRGRHGFGGHVAPAIWICKEA